MAVLLLFSLQHIYGFLLFKNDYSVLNGNPGLNHVYDETYVYAPQIQNILNGYWGGDVYIWEYRNTAYPYLNQSLSNLPVAFLSRVFSSISSGFLVSDLVFPPLLFLLITFFLIRLGFSKSLAVVSGLIVIVTPYFSVLFPGVSGFQIDITGPSNSGIFFTRTPHPQVSALFLFASIFLTTVFLKNPGNKFAFLWAIVTGLTLYSTSFNASTVVLALFFLAPVFFVKIPPKKILMSGLIGFLISVPLVAVYLKGLNVLPGSDFLERLSFEKNFLFPIQVRFVFISLVYFLLSKKTDFSKVLLSFVISASVLTDLHQVLLGRNIQADHFVSRILAPICSMIFVLIAGEIVRHFKSFKNFWWFIAVIILMLGFYRQLTWLKQYSNYLKLKPGHKEIISRIINTTRKDDVIGSLDTQLNNEIRAVTGRWVFTGAGDVSFVSSDEQSERICKLVLASGKNDETAKNQNLDYILALEKNNSKKFSFYKQKLDECIRNKNSLHKFRLNYIVKNDPKTNNLVLERI